MQLCIVTGGGDITAAAGPVGVDELARAAEQLVSMGAEVIALSLNQVRGKHCRTVSVVECKGGGEAWSRNAQRDGRSNHTAPRTLALGDFLAEKVIQQEIIQRLILIEGILDVAQEDRADDAPTAPHEGNTAVVEFPIKLGGCLAKQHESLRIGNYLGGIQGLNGIFNEDNLV